MTAASLRSVALRTIPAVVLMLSLCLNAKNGYAASARTSTEAADNWLEMFLPPAEPLDTPVIAHGLGQIGGHRVTNSIDALHENYRRGIRVFEVDLLMTSDHRLVARHDWKAYLYPFLGQDYDGAQGPIPYAAVMSLMIHDTYRPASFEDILQAMKRYPDLFIVTDTKDTDRASIQQTFSYLVAKAREVDPSLLDRIIPQIYNKPMLGYIKAHYDFPHVIYTLYRESATLSPESVISFSREHGIDAITMDSYRYSASFVEQLNKAGLRSFVNTVNDAAEAAKYKADGVTGMYTDDLLYDGSQYLLSE